MIDLDEYLERLCRIGSDGGPRPLSRKRRDREILMKSMLSLMDSGREYREPEINELLSRWMRDVAPAIETDSTTLRRLLVDYGELERTRDGATYRIGFPARPVVFELEVEDVDVVATTAAYRDHKQREAAARPQRQIRRKPGSDPG